MFLSASYPIETDLYDKTDTKGVLLSYPDPEKNLDVSVKVFYNLEFTGPITIIIKRVCLRVKTI